VPNGISRKFVPAAAKWGYPRNASVCGHSLASFAVRYRSAGALQRGRKRKYTMCGHRSCSAKVAYGEIVARVEISFTYISVFGHRKRWFSTEIYVKSKNNRIIEIISSNCQTLAMTRLTTRTHTCTHAGEYHVVPVSHARTMCSSTHRYTQHIYTGIYKGTR
jgi:hypothetical protein